MSEEWRVIEEFPNYSVSSLGRVRFNPTGRNRKILTRPNGYCYFTMSKGKKASIHRCVAKAFLPNPENKPEVDHIDRDRSNNILSNLRWATISENKHNRSVLKNNKLQEKYIVLSPRNLKKRYIVGMTTTRVEKAYFATLEEAIQFRDGMLDLYS